MLKNKEIEIQSNLILWTPCHYALVFFILSLGKTFKLSRNSTPLIWTPIDVEYEHLLRVQSTDSHRKSTSLMPTPHCKVCEPRVIQVELLKVEKPSLDNLSLFPEIQIQQRGCRYFQTTNFQHQTSSAEKGFDQVIQR